MMAIGLVGFISSFGLCGLALWLGLRTAEGRSARCCCSRCSARSTVGFGSAAPPAIQAYVASRTSRAERTQALSLISSSGSAPWSARHLAP